MVTPNYYLFQGILLALIKLLVRLVHPLLLLALLVRRHGIEAFASPRMPSALQGDVSALCNCLAAALP